MKLHRFIGDFKLDEGGEIIITDQTIINQVRNVFRFKTGSRFVLATPDGREAMGEILSLDKNNLTVKLTEVKQNANEPANEAILFLSLLKKENFELAVQKATEIGIKKIVPLISSRTVKTGLNEERLQKIIKEAAEQSGRGILPGLAEPQILAEALKATADNDLNVFFDAGGEMINGPFNADRIGIFIGPEGGWTDEEKEMAREAGCRMIGLGKLTLRAETAAIVASYLAVKF